MSVETDPVPPVPEHTPPLQEDAAKNDAGKSFNHTWTRWFTSVRAKINVINDSFVNLGDVGAGPGLLAKNGAAWLFRTITGAPGKIDITNGDGSGGNPSINLVPTGVTPGTYGDSSNIPVIDVDEDGRIVSITTVPVSGGGGGIYFEDVLTANTVTLTSGNLVATGNAASGGMARGNSLKNTGKWYIETVLTTYTTSGSNGCGILGISGISEASTSYLGQANTSAGIWRNGTNVNRYNNGSATSMTGLPVNGDVLALAWDADAGMVWFALNGSWYSGDPAAGTSPSYNSANLRGVKTFAVCPRNVGNVVTLNTSPLYTVPTGFSYWN